MTSIERRVQYSGGTLGPLTVDDLNTLSKYIDRVLRQSEQLNSEDGANDDFDISEVATLSKKEADVLDKADGYFKEVVLKATTTGQVF